MALTSPHVLEEQRLSPTVRETARTEGVLGSPAALPADQVGDDLEAVFLRRSDGNGRRPGFPEEARDASG
jgi:hypothetical protein